MSDSPVPPASPSDASAASGPRTPALSWPPPGLGRVQGELLSGLAVTGLGGLVLVVPLLWAVAGEQEPWSLGPWGGGWWFPVVTSAFGFALLFVGFTLLVRMFWTARTAVSRGHDRLTAWLAAADWRRDTGFLIQGARMYSEIAPDTRRRILTARLWGARLLLFAVLWLPVSFAVSVLIAARGGMGPTAMWIATVGPTLLAALAGAGALAYGRFHLARTGRQWERRPGVAEERRAQIEDWRSDMEALPTAGRPPLRAGGGPGFRLAPAGLVLLFLVVVVPISALVLAATIGPLLAAMAVPHYAGVQEQAGAAEPLRTFRLEADTTITPRAAGEALHTLSHVAEETGVEELEAVPARRYAEPWFPAEAPGDLSSATPEELIERASAGFTEEEVAYLRRVAEHPALQEVELLARAPRADLVGARWQQPLPEDADFLGLPVPRLRTLREGARAHLTTAALRFSEGDVEAAEETIREVISAGLLLADEGPTLVDNMVGLMMAESGADALEALYRASGRQEQADNVRWARESAARAAELMVPLGEAQNFSAQLEDLSYMVTAPHSLRGVRWEQYALVNTLAPCLNLHNVVFGPGGRHEEWREQARRRMVRYPSEESLLTLADRGWVSGTEDEGWMETLLSLTLGDAEGRASCADLLGAATQRAGL